MTAQDDQATREAIRSLAEEIARTSPECAPKAMRIISLLQELDAAPDRAVIEDAIEAETEGELSDSQVRNASGAVVRSLGDRS